MTPFELLEYGKEKKLPAADLLSQLGFFNDQYQRFLIEVIWYGGYGTADQVLIDLRGAQEINNIWGFLEFSSEIECEKQLGIDNLKWSGLRFIDQFIWWEKGLNLLRHGE